MTKREACHAVFDDLGTLGALLAGIMHDASCSLRFVNADFLITNPGTGPFCPGTGSTLLAGTCSVTVSDPERFLCY